MPDLQTSPQLQRLNLLNNDFLEFPPLLPPELKLFDTGGNARVQGTGTQVAALLTGSPLLKDIGISIDSTLRSAWAMQHGVLPNFFFSGMLKPVPRTCYIGEPCELEMKMQIL